MPVTARPNFGSSSSIVWPPASTAPDSVILLSAPATIWCSTSGSSFLAGNMARLRQVIGLPPIA